MEQWMRETCIVRGSSQRHLKLVEESKAIITQILRQIRRPYVAFSCGKDSSVLAHLATSVDKAIPLRFLSSGETRLIHGVDKVLDYFAGIGCVVDEINIDRVFSEEWKDASWDEQRKAGKKDMLQLNLGDWDGVFMGLRIQESGRRKYSLLVHQSPDLPRFCHSYKGKAFIRCCPLAKWTTEDIGAYLIKHNIPWLDHYDYCGDGFGGRTTARLTGDAVRQNALSHIKRHRPQEFNRLVERFPEFRYYI